MKKNVFFIVVDSFIADKVGNDKSSISPTPFLDELKKKSLYCSNMYSQGPHTEAGCKALLTGFDSMDYGGYMHNLHEAPTTYLNVFKQEGYTIFDYFLPYYLYSTKEFENIDYQYFTSDFLFESVWEHRLLRFAKIRELRPLTELERYDARKQLELTFIAWMNIYEKWYRGDKYSFICLLPLCELFDWDSNYKLLKEEWAKFKDNKDAYLDTILNQGTDCNLYKIQRFDFPKLLNQSFVDENVFKKHHTFFRKLRKKQLLRGLKNVKVNKSKFLSSLGESIRKRSLSGYFKQYIYALACSEIAKGYKQDKFYQTLPSMRKILRTAIAEIKEKRTDAPVMLHCHPEELHNRVNYFSFDINDKELIDHEFEMFEKYVDSLKKDYCGNILYDCALLYVDDCIKELYQTLDSEGLLKKSIIIVCADHGSSYGCNPIRGGVNTPNTENYHIPLWIFDGAEQKCVYNDKYHTSKDILATVYNICGFEKPKSVSGEVITETSGDTIAVSEHTEGGCPDIRTRPIVFIARNKKYLIVYHVRFYSPFTDGKLVEAYDLEKDSLELENIVDSIKRDEISDLLEAIEQRQQNILKTYNELHPGMDWEPYKMINGINI